MEIPRKRNKVGLVVSAFAFLFLASSAGAQRTELVVLTGFGGDVNAVAFSPDGKTLASACNDVIEFWDVASGQALRSMVNHYDTVNTIAFSPDGRTLASGNWHKAVILWDEASGRKPRSLKTKASVSSVAFSPDGRTVAEGGLDGRILLWDVVSGHKLRDWSAKPVESTLSSLQHRLAELGF